MDSRAYASAAIPDDEKARIEELYSLKLLDAASDLRFDRFTSLVATLYDFPIVTVTFVDSELQWFKSSCGLDVTHTSRDVSFCAHTIHGHSGLLVVPDTHKDLRFANNPLVIGPPYIRFYAGAVVNGPLGHALGALCAIDRVPRDFSLVQQTQLRQFADLVETEIRHHYDITTLRHSIQFDACYDTITRLPNRHLLTICLSKLLALPSITCGKVAAILLHLPDLYLLKQSLGSAAVDQMLLAFAERLRACCPAGGTVARLESDEFAMVFATFGDGLIEVDDVMQETKATLDKPFTKSNDRYVRVRVGVSLYPDDGACATELLDRASSAARSSIKSGQCEYYNKADAMTVCERVQIESQLRGALEKNHLHLVYQPIVSLADGHLHCVEALLRWNDPEMGAIPPDIFIPIAEQSGLIATLGEWVQKEVCRQLQQWQLEDGWATPVAINVAASELLQPAFAGKLLQRLDSLGIAPQWIIVEVTECSQLADSRQADTNIKQLHDACIHINIDDFGTGYSSLEYLRRMPIRKLKIDRSFVGGLPDDKREVTLIQTILGMAGALSLGTVAEGVETKAQLDYLRSAHCELVQGFYISRPVLPSKIPAMRDRVLA